MGVMNAPLMPLMPLLHTLGGFNSQVVGAWIGGSIDSTGQVAASAQMAGDDVLQNAIIIKMSQNILIAPICVVVSSIFRMREQAKIEQSTKADSASTPDYSLVYSNPITASPESNAVAKKPTLSTVLFDNFKNLVFIGGFIVTSFVVSVLISTSSYQEMNKIVIPNLWFISEWITLIGFVLIGLDIDIETLRSKEFHAYLKTYLIIQAFDIGSTLGWSYLMFKDFKSSSAT